MTARLLLVPLALGLLAGCGYVGEPLPPALKTPSRVEDLRAIERGDRIIVRFTIPPLTEDGLPLELDEAELWAGPWRDAPGPDEWALTAERIPVPDAAVGENHVEFPVAGRAGQDLVLAVRLTNRNGRRSAWSNLVNLPVVEPLPPPVDVRAEAAPEGVRLSWRYPVERPDLHFLIYRQTEEQDGAHFAARADAPEWVDTDTQYGKRFVYLVQARQMTGATAAESPAAPPVAIVPEDRFPPAVPAGLRAVAGLGSIELTWEPSAEPDLAGYRLYRAAGDATFSQLAELEPGVSYSDRDVTSGERYRYRLSAFDRQGNESQPSEPVELTMP